MARILKYRDLRRARALLATRANRDFPDMRMGGGRSQIAARLGAANIDVSGAMKLVREIMKENEDPLRFNYKCDEKQLAVVEASILAGMALGVTIGELRD